MHRGHLVEYNGNNGVKNPAIVLRHNEENDECELAVLGCFSDGGNINNGQITHFNNVPKGTGGHTWSDE